MRKREIQNTIDEHLKVCKQLRLSPKHIASKRSILNCLAKTAPEKTKLDDWTIQDCFFYLEARRRSGVSVFTCALETRVIKSFWCWAKNEGYILESPAAKLMLPPLPKIERAPILEITTEQIKALEGRVPKDVYAAIIIIWGLALRAKDIPKLREKDIDETAMTLRCKDPKRLVPIPDQAVLHSLYIVIASHTKPTGQKVSFYGAVKRATKETEFPASAAKLRESAIYRWGKEGIDPRNIQKWSGFTTLETTYKYLPKCKAQTVPLTGLLKENEQ